MHTHTQMCVDVAFLEDFKLMDYSLFVGVHTRSPSEPPMHPEGDRSMQAKQEKAFDYVYEMEKRWRERYKYSDQLEPTSSAVCVCV